MLAPICLIAPVTLVNPDCEPIVPLFDPFDVFDIEVIVGDSKG